VRAAPRHVLERAIPPTVTDPPSNSSRAVMRSPGRALVGKALYGPDSVAADPQATPAYTRHRTGLADGVVPFAVPVVAGEGDLVHLLIGDLDAGGVPAGVVGGVDGE
jgi:hypothetical protein